MVFIKITEKRGNNLLDFIFKRIKVDNAILTSKLVLV